jgi:hypothetical protein
MNPRPKVYNPEPSPRSLQPGVHSKQAIVSRASTNKNCSHGFAIRMPRTVQLGIHRQHFSAGGPQPCIHSHPGTHNQEAKTRGPLPGTHSQDSPAKNSQPVFFMHESIASNPLPRVHRQAFRVRVSQLGIHSQACP